MHHRHAGADLKLCDAADISGSDDLRLDACDVAELALSERACELRLQHVVGAGGAAAEMPFRNLDYLKARLLQELLRTSMDLLAMLERARGVIGHARPGRERAVQSERLNDLAHVL